METIKQEKIWENKFPNLFPKYVIIDPIKGKNITAYSIYPFIS